MTVVARSVSGAVASLLVCCALAACSSSDAPEARARGTGGGSNSGVSGAPNLNTGSAGAGNGLNISTGGSGAAPSVDCGTGPSTSISGTVYDPAGATPLYNVVVYVPGEALSPIATGAACQTCDGDFSGKPLAVTLSDAAGHFKLDNAPSGDNVPLVIQVGKWRREVTLAHVNSCADNPLVDKDMTRLPRTQAEGNIPHIAVSLGGSDSLECLLRRIGIADSEFTTPDQAGRVHLYRSGENAAKTMNIAGKSVTVPESDTLWSNLTSLMSYDLMLLSCTGESKLGVADADYENVRAYADKGGRIFGSHWHDAWIRTDAKTTTDPLWYPQVVQFASSAHGIDAPLTAKIDTSFPKGASFSDWLTNVGATTVPGQIVIQGAEHTVDSVLPKAIMDPAVPTYAAGPGAQQWIYATDPTDASKPTNTVQYFSMNTPVGGAECGRMVFSDLHVSTGSGDTTKVPFPTGCSSSPLTPQELALEFMLFDLSSCVQPDTDMVTVPVVPK
jgi:hypothetical protein